MRVHILQHTASGVAGAIYHWLHAKKLSWTRTRVFLNEPLPTMHSFDLLIILGGPMGANDTDKYAWLQPEIDCIAAAVAADKSVFGICLGAQLVARVLGATVKRHTVSEIGWFPLKRVAAIDAHPICRQLPDSFYAFQWHNDTFSLPPDAIHLLASEACVNQGYVWRDRVVGVQCHIEVTPESASIFMHKNHKMLTRSDQPYIQSVAEMLTYRGCYAESEAICHRLLDYFAAHHACGTS